MQAIAIDEGGYSVFTASQLRTDSDYRNKFIKIVSKLLTATSFNHGLFKFVEEVRVFRELYEVVVVPSNSLGSWLQSVPVIVLYAVLSGRVPPNRGSTADRQRKTRVTQKCLHIYSVCASLSDP